MTITEIISQAILYIWGGTGYCWLIIYLFIFYVWKKRTKHKMRFDFGLITKWFIICSLMVPLGAIIAYFEYVEIPLFLFLSDFRTIIICICLLLIACLLYKCGFIKKHELFIPLVFWSPAIILMIYKKRQTELMQKETSKYGSDL